MELRNPARYRRAIALVFFSELPAQRRLLIKDDKQVGSQQHADHVDRDVPRVEQPGLSSYDEPDSDVHRIEPEAVQPLQTQAFSSPPRYTFPSPHHRTPPTTHQRI